MNQKLKEQNSISREINQMNQMFNTETRTKFQNEQNFTQTKKFHQETNMGF